MRKFKQYLLSFKNNYLDARKKHQEHFDHAARKGYYTYAEEGRGLVKKVDSLLAQLERDTHFHETPTPAMHQTFKQAKKHAKQLTEMVKPLWRQWIESLGVALLLVFVLRNFVFGLYHVPTGSAEPNILVGDRVWGNKMAYFFDTVKHGDLVIFDNPEFPYDRSSKLNYYWQRYIGLPIPILGLSGGPENLVKRAIAIPGDVIQGKIENGKTVIYRNGKKLDEPFVNRLPLIRVRKEVGFIPFKRFGPFSIPHFLQKMNVERNYTFDPEKSLNDQPCYRLESNEIVHHPAHHERIFSYAYDPIYSMDFRHEGNVFCADEFGPITIPAGKYWMMGDSRKNSRDSRYWHLLDKELIHGRASFVIYSIDSEESFWLFELIKHPLDFWTKKIRWNRFFKALGTFNGTQE